MLECWSPTIDSLTRGRIYHGGQRAFFSVNLSALLVKKERLETQRLAILRMGFKPLQDVCNLGQKMTRASSDAVGGAGDADHCGIDLA